MAQFIEMPADVGIIDVLDDVLANAAYYNFDPDEEIELWRQGASGQLHSSVFCTARPRNAKQVQIAVNELARHHTDDWCPQCVGATVGAMRAHVGVGALGAWLSTGTVIGVANAFIHALNARRAAPDHALDAILARHARTTLAAIADTHRDVERIVEAGDILAAYDTNSEAAKPTTAAVRALMHPGAVAWTIARRHHRGLDNPTLIAESMLAVTFADPACNGENCRNAAELDLTNLYFRQADRRAAERIHDGTVLFVCVDAGLDDAQRQIATGLYANGMGVSEAVELATLIAAHV